MELIRKILFAAEKDGQPLYGSIVIDEYDPALVAEHAHLCVQKGLVQGESKVTMAGIRVVRLGQLTWDGHDFLSAIREDTVWNQLKSKIGQPLASIPFEVIKAAGVALTRQLIFGRLGLE